jgi:hypothetical protein
MAGEWEDIEPGLLRLIFLAPPLIAQTSSDSLRNRQNYNRRAGSRQWPTVFHKFGVKLDDFQRARQISTSSDGHGTDGVLRRDHNSRHDELDARGRFNHPAYVE